MEQETFDFYEKSKEELYKEALNQPLEEKIRLAIGFLKLHEQTALGLADYGYTLCFSGGKDSAVIYELAKLAKVKHKAFYSNVTIDPPDLIYHIKKNYPEVEWVNPKKHLIARMVEKGTPPTRLIRWCCEEYKENSVNYTGKIIGVRADESANRKATWKQVTMHRKQHSPIFAPILYWTDKDIWDFHKLYNIPNCKLYDEGWKRVGCVGCPMAGKGRIAEFERYPKYKEMWIRGLKKLMVQNPNKKNGEPRFFMKFKDEYEFFNWWMEEKITKEDECQMTLQFT